MIHKLPRAKYFIATKTLLLALSRLLFFSLKRTHVAIRFEELFASTWQVKRCLTTSSFRIGLYHTLQALNLDPRDEVILTPITIPDTINAIQTVGLKPVFIDLEAQTHNINIKELDNVITPQSRVLLVTHLAGISPNIEVICQAAKKYDLFIIEDFSQAYGATYAGHFLGTFGNIGIGSLSIGKNITSLVGGVLISNEIELIKKISLLIKKDLTQPKKITFAYQLIDNIKINIITSKYTFSFIFYYILKIIFRFKPERISTIHERKYVEKYINREIFFDDLPRLRTSMPKDFFFWFSDWQALLATHMLKRFQDSNHQRKVLAKILFDNLSTQVKAMLPLDKERFFENTFYHFPLNLGTERNDLQQFLFKNGIDSGGYGLTLCSHSSAFSAFQAETPIAEKIKKESLFLPVHEDFTPQQMYHIANIVNEFYEKRSFTKS